MHNTIRSRVASALIGTVTAAAALFAPFGERAQTAPDFTLTASAASATTIDDMPSEYQYAADWIWNNRIMNEDSCGVKSSRYNLLFDQIIRNGGELNYVVRWQSTQTVSYEQRQQFAAMVETGVNQWCDWLVGYENWPYEHVKVNIVGWAVIDKSYLSDIHDDEVVWDQYSEAETNTDILSNGAPSVIPCGPETLWTFNYFGEKNHVYNGQTYDEYLWCTQNYGTDYGGCGGDWGQRLSDNYYLSAASGSGFPHIYWHELGHGFGMTDFYGDEGASDGFPPGGFPGGENSIMMAGSASKITDFDGWMLRYMWTQIKDTEGRFDIPEVVETTSTTTEEPAVTTTSAPEETEDTGTTTTTTAESEKIEYKGATVDTTGAAAVEYTIKGSPWAGANGVVGYWDQVKYEADGEGWVTEAWDCTLGENGEYTLTFEVPEGINEIQISIYWSGVWDNDIQGMVDVYAEVSDYSVIKAGEFVTTTETTATTTSSNTKSETTTTTKAAESETAASSSADATTTSSVTTTARQSRTTTGQSATTAAQQSTTTTAAQPSETTKAETQPVTSTEAAATTTAAEQVEADLYGDANGDGKVNMADAVFIMQCNANPAEYHLTAKGKANADVSGNGDGVTNNDALTIQQFEAGIVKKLPV